MSERPILAWHFLPADGRLRYGDGRAPKDGKWLRANRAPDLCNGGMHASRKLTDALRYAPGLTLCRVQVRGGVVEGDDKLTGWERRALWRIDAREVVVAFAQGCAKRAKGYADAAAADAYYAAAAAAAAEDAASVRWAAYAAAAAAAAAAKERRIQERNLTRLVREARRKQKGGRK